MSTAAAGTLAVNLTAVDRLSAPLARINAGVVRLVGSVGRLATVTRSSAGLDRLAVAARSAAQSIGQIVPPLSAITAAGSIVGVYRLVSGWAQLGAQLGRTAYRVQTTATGLQVLQGAARLAGSSAEDVAQGLEGLGDALSDAVGGRDDTAVQYFRLLGINMRDASGNARTASEVLPELADGIARIADPRLQARVMGALRLPAGLLPFLRRGAAGLREYEAEARRAGAISEEGAEAARSFELAQARLSLAGQGLVNVLAARLAPVLVPLLDRLSSWLIEKGPQLGARVEDLAKRFSAWVDEGGLTRLGERLEAVGTGISTVIGWMGGLENAAIALGVVLTARVLSPLGRLLGLAARMGVGAAMAPGVATAAVIGGTAYGLHEMLRRYRETEAGSPERQTERRGLWRDRALAAPGLDNDVERGIQSWSEVGDRLARLLGAASPERLTGRLAGPDRMRAQDALPPTDSGRSGGVPRGIRNNNPLNLGYYPGQEGLDPTRPHDGRFGIYTSMEAGIAAAVRQMQIHADRRGARTLGQMIGLWAPPGENDTAGYVARVAAETGIDPNAAVDWRDAGTLRRVVGAMARMENGRAIDGGVVERGVDRALGRPAPAAAAAPGGETRSVVELRFTNPPPGLTAVTRGEGAGVRIERPTLGAGP